MLRNRLVLMFAIIAISLASWFMYDQWKPSDEGTLVFETQLPILSEESLSRLPDGFPSHYILGLNARVIDGGATPVNSWVTVQVDDDALNITSQYRQYFSSLNWSIEQDVATSGQYIITAKKNGNELQVTATAVTGGTFVRLVFTPGVITNSL